MREYLDNISTASSAKEERMQQMANDARRKDDQLAAMLSRMDAKDQQMNDLIAQVTNMATQSKPDDSDDNKSNRKRNNKRKAQKEGGAGRTGSGENGEALPLKSKNGWWTPHAKFNFGIKLGESFSAAAVKWDPSWPADKRAYYNARKETQEKGNAYFTADKKAAKIAALKAQLAALE